MTCRVPFVLLAGLCSLVLVLLVTWLMIFEYLGSPVVPFTLLFVIGSLTK